MDNCALCGCELKSFSTTDFTVEFDCLLCGRVEFDTQLWNGGTIAVDDFRLKRNKLVQLLHEHMWKWHTPVRFAAESGVALAGGPCVTIDEFLSRYPASPLEYFDRALLNISRTLIHPVAFRDIFAQSSIAQCLLFCDDEDDAREMLLVLREQKLIENRDSYFRYCITPAGWKRVGELTKATPDAKQAFVAMWFDPQHSQYFDQGMRPAIESHLGMKALRIDSKEHNGKIDDEIVAEIRRSRYLVADFTGHRGGVYFEAGLAMGLGMPVIWTVHQDHIGDCHFDTRQYNHITYSTPEELRVKLTNRIRATIT